MAGAARTGRTAAGVESEERLGTELQLDAVADERSGRQSRGVEVSGLHGAGAGYAALTAVAGDSWRHWEVHVRAMDRGWASIRRSAWRRRGFRRCWRPTRSCSESDAARAEDWLRRSTFCANGTRWGGTTRWARRCLYEWRCGQRNCGVGMRAIRCFLSPRWSRRRTGWKRYTERGVCNGAR